MSSSLHNHTEYSILDGFGHPEEYLKKAKEIGLKAFAITEHGNEYSWVYFDELKKNYPEIKMIYGVEFYECFNHLQKEKDNKYFHLIALAKNEAGRIALNELVTKSNFEGFYFKPRVDLEMMKPYAENLIVSSACLASKLSREQDEEKCVEYIEEYKEIFPHFYLEMQSHDTADQKAYNQKILKLAHWTNTPFIITTDSHAATKEDLKYQGYHVKIARDSETESEIYSGCYMQTDEEIHAIMDPQIGRENVTVALEETDRIADLIEEVNMPFQSPQLPTYPLPEGYTDNATFLRDLCEKGWKTRHVDEMTEEEQKVRRERLEYELGIIHQMGFDGYFLIVWDFINYAKSHDIIVGDGRGCFTKDALIWCKDKLKTIDTVDVGDEVLSADGNFHKVLKTFKYNINEPTIEFTYKQQGSSRKKYVNRCTMDHHVLVHRDGKNEYVPAKSLKVGDLLCSPKVKSNQNISCVEIDLNDHDFQEFKQDAGFLYLPVEAVTTIDSEPVPVYDLSVAEEHNFVINNVVVHNSGGGSLVNYLIGISELDPIEYDLIFERFLNPERVSMPDIDIDFADRESIINYLCQKYGDDKVCQVINFSYITPIVAIKDVGRVLGIPYYICEKISKKFAYPTFDECVQNSPDLYEKYAEYGELFEIAAHISGRVRNVSIHAGGVGIVDTKITDYMAMKLGGNGEHVIQVDKRKIEEIGIIKFDILGVATLGVVQEVKKAVGLTDWNLSVANPAFIHDEKMYKLLQEAKTNGVFQVESSGMKDLLVRLKPTSLEDVSAVLALYRPDSMSMLEDYIYYKHHPTEVKYWHPDMEPLLNKTYGCIIYQEEIMDIVRVFGGRSRGGADLFRKAIGKKNVELVKKESEKLYSEILIQGYEEWLAKQISDYLAKMGGYSFNKCVSGDTKLVRISQQKNQFLPTVAEMYRIKNDRKYAVQMDHLHLHKKYSKTYGFSLSMDKDGRVRKNRIVDIRYSGMREVFQITTESGAKVKATDNHKIPTSHGIKLLKELKIGDELFVIGDYEVCKNTYNLTDGNFESNCPKIGEMGFQFKEYSVTNNYNNTKAEKKGQRCSCEICGKPYDENARFELHHKNFDRTNNDCDNFSWLCASCHKKEHYRKNNRKKSYQKGYPTKLEKIISIESVGVTETYDVEMEAPNHNFAVESGIIVCNSHSALYSILTLKTAYLKAHYPAHFFCALLNQNKGNYGTINKYILDAKDFGVEVLPPKINLSSNNFTVQNGKILFGFEAVNGIGKQLADKIIEQRKISKFTGFKDFLERVAPSVKQVVYLTKAGAFPAKDKQNFLLKYAKSLFPVRSYEPVSSLPKLSILKEKFGIDTDVIRDKEERLRLYNQAREHDFNIQQVNKYQTHMSDFAEKYLPDPAFWEFEALSVFIQNNPFEEAYQYISKTFDDIDEGEECIVVGVISNVQKKKDRNKNQYAFINLYSAFGLVELTCWHSQFKKFEELIKRGTQIAVLAEKKTDKAIVIEMKSYQSWLKSRHILKE